ncbi:hypothetical protein Ahy_B07g087934 [Arachis hypogaea]|uniref:FAR1 domain-containing protein n=1 Tax=Arachis hypogaea TaxID=3818 RepID=A0A444YDC0_ARAHY|nr:hypothetical protein Ahy_B07g087934 [Arachis hypogaea]
MNESTSNQLNECDLDYSLETHQFDETSCVVDERFVPKVEMIFETLEEAAKFYKHYSKLASFSTKIRNTTRDGDKIKNQLIVCTREGRWKSKISPTLKTNPSAVLNCPARIYVHIMKDVGVWTILKVVLNDSRPCCSEWAEMLKQHRELSMFMHRTIETHEEAEIRLSKTYQSFVVAAGSHRELGFIEKDVRNYITREVRNIFKEDDAKEFGKGILCRHSLSILSFERVDNMAPKYILERWSKNIKRRHTHIKSSQDEPLLELRSKRFDELVMAEMEEYQERSKGKNLLTYEKVTLSNVNDLQSPPRVKTRGWPKNILGSNLEKRQLQASCEFTIRAREGSRWLWQSYCFRFPNHLLSEFIHFMQQKIWTILVFEVINLFLHFN